MHSAAAEPGYLARGEQAGDRAFRRTEYPPRQVGLQSAQRLARENVETDRDQGASVRVE